MKKIALVFTLLLRFHLLHSQQVFTPVFESGKDGYTSYRIPAIIRSPDGDLLAFCEGRVHGADDFGNIDIVMKSSKDNGATWTPLKIIADAGALQAGNPAPVVDLTDPAFPKGRIFLFYNTGNNHESEVRKGNGQREAWMITSIDNGTTWSTPVNITQHVHKPGKPDDWRSYANTPGHAMQFLNGPYKGRIFIPANHSAGAPQEDFVDYHAHGYFTDDHGKTFQLGTPVKLPGSNESTAAILSDGRLMMNSRNQRGDIKARIISISSNGGSSWDTTYFDHNLPDPVNEGSLLSIGMKKGKSILVFSNAADTVQRNHLTLRSSEDDGRTWRKSIPVYAGDPNNTKIDYAAYSDLVDLGHQTIGILFEKDDYSSIVFTRTSIDF
jgi:sialidase-1